MKTQVELTKELYINLLLCQGVLEFKKESLSVFSKKELRAILKTLLHLYRNNEIEIPADPILKTFLNENNRGINSSQINKSSKKCLALGIAKLNKDDIIEDIIKHALLNCRIILV